MLNASRRFRYTLDLRKEEEKEQRKRMIRAHAQVIRVMLNILVSISLRYYCVSVRSKRCVLVASGSIAVQIGWGKANRYAALPKYLAIVFLAILCFRTLCLSFRSISNFGKMYKYSIDTMI